MDKKISKLPPLSSEQHLKVRTVDPAKKSTIMSALGVSSSARVAVLSSVVARNSRTRRGRGESKSAFTGDAMVMKSSSSSRTISMRSTSSSTVAKKRTSVKVNAIFGGENKGSGDSEDEFKKIVNDVVYVDPVVGAKRFSNYFWASVVTAGASGFLITGASAYFKHNLVFFLDASDIEFFPQGLVMSFYGIAGLLLATYLWLTINWNVGAGYNEFNKEEGIFRVFRYGFPGKNRRVNLLTDLKDVTAVRVEIADGINPRRVVYVKCKGKGDIPLTRIGQPLTLEEVERQAAELAKFLQVPIEGL